MFENLPSLLFFKPRFYAGGPMGVHLPLLYDLVAKKKPRSIVTLGFGDGQAFFTFCQAAREQKIECRCVVVRRSAGHETDDVAWSEGKIEGQKSYRDVAEFRSESPSELAQAFPEGSIELLLIDDCDSGSEIRQELSSWDAKLGADALVLLHGTQLERADSPRAAWQQWVSDRLAAELTDGIGLGIARRSLPNHARANIFSELFGEISANGDLPQLHRLASGRIDAEARAAQSARDRAALQVQKAWLSSLVAMGAQAQRMMANQAERIQELHRDRANAQVVMDSQAEQLQNWVGTAEKLRTERDKLKAQVKEQERSCRKGGKCFRALSPQESKSPRPIGERFLREIQRWPRNLRRLFSPPTSESVRVRKRDRHGNKTGQA